MSQRLNIPGVQHNLCDMFLFVVLSWLLRSEAPVPFSLYKAMCISFPFVTFLFPDISNNYDSAPPTWHCPLAVPTLTATVLLLKVIAEPSVWRKIAMVMLRLLQHGYWKMAASAEKEAVIKHFTQVSHLVIHGHDHSKKVFNIQYHCQAAIMSCTEGVFNSLLASYSMVQLLSTETMDETGETTYTSAMSFTLCLVHCFRTKKFDHGIPTSLISDIRIRLQISFYVWVAFCFIGCAATSAIGWHFFSDHTLLFCGPLKKTKKNKKVATF